MNTQKNTESPRISIIIPVFNGSNYLREAIDSALKQRYDNFEVIVINDGSNDGGDTETIALSYGNQIRYYKKDNGGVSSALNLGLSVMNGDWFSWLSHDDLYLPDKLSSQSKIIRDNPNVDVVISNYAFVNKNGFPIKRWHAVWKKGFLNKNMAIKLLISKGTPNGCATLIRKSSALIVDSFDTKYIYTQDRHFFLKLIAKNCGFFVTRELTTKSRIHSGQVTVLKKNLYNSEVVDTFYEFYDNNMYNCRNEHYFIKQLLLTTYMKIDRNKKKQLLDSMIKAKIIRKSDFLSLKLIFIYLSFRETLKKIRTIFTNKKLRA